MLNVGRLPRPGGPPTVIQTRSVRFRGPVQEGAADSSCKVLSDAGRDYAALVQCGALETALETVQGDRIDLLASLVPAPTAAW